LFLEPKIDNYLRLKKDYCLFVRSAFEPEFGPKCL